jgi:spermine oxidase
MSQKIVIVGAGLSGMSAAAKLMEKGFTDIVILEAEDRIGGRIHSVPYGGGFIDLGAQWCHGQGKNVIYELVNRYFSFGDTGFDNTDEIYYLSTGKPAVQKQCLKLAGLTRTIMEESFAEMEKFNRSLGEFFTVKYRHGLKDVKYNTIPAELAEQMLDYSHKDWIADFASPTLFDISAKLNAQSESTTGNQYLTWKTQGFKTVFDFITVRIIDLNRLKLITFNFRKSFQFPAMI